MSKVLKKVLHLIFAGLLVLAFSGVSAQGKDDDIRLRVFVHHPGPHPQESSSCTVTTNDQVNDYGLAGWQLTSSGYSYKINHSTIPSSVGSAADSAIANALATWNTADPDKTFIYTEDTNVKAAKLDGINAILWKGIRGGAIAITYAWYYRSTGNLAEADMVLNKNLPWAVNDSSLGDCGGDTSAYDLQNIVTHESGHIVGLDDLYDGADQDLTMFGYGTKGELKKDSLGLGDVTGTNVLTP